MKMSPVNLSLNYKYLIKIPSNKLERRERGKGDNKNDLGNKGTGDLLAKVIVSNNISFIL